MKRLFLLSLLVLVSAAACRPQGPTAPTYTPALTPAAAGVSVIDKMQPGCTPAGQIVGRAAAPESGEVVWRYALNDLRNQALSRRVMVVFMEKYDHSTEKGLLHIRITGTLLQCGNGEPGGPEGTTPPVGPGPADPVEPPPPAGPGADPGEEIQPPPAGDDPEAVTPPPVQ